MFSCHLAHDGKSVQGRVEEAERKEYNCNEIEKRSMSREQATSKYCPKTHQNCSDSIVRNNFSECLESRPFSSLTDPRNEKHQSSKEVDIESNYEELFGDWWEDNSAGDKDVTAREYKEIPSYNWSQMSSNGDCYKYDVFFEEQFLHQDCGCGMIRKVE